MKRKLVQLFTTCLMALLLSVVVSAATITPTETNIILAPGEDTVTFDLIVNAQHQLVTADFYLKTTGEGLIFQPKAFKLNVSGNKSVIDHTEKYGYAAMGFYTTGAGYAPNLDHNFCSVTYTYTGDEDCTIYLYRASLTYWDENDEFLITDEVESYFTIHISRETQLAVTENEENGYDMTLRYQFETPFTGLIYITAYDEKGRMVDLFTTSAQNANEGTEVFTMEYKDSIAHFKLFFMENFSFCPQRDVKIVTI